MTTLKNFGIIDITREKGGIYIIYLIIFISILGLWFFIKNQEVKVAVVEVGKQVAEDKEYILEKLPIHWYYFEEFKEEDLEDLRQHYEIVLRIV